MNKFDIEFVTELFLDSDCVANTNRLVLAVANALNENNNIMVSFNDVINDEYYAFSENEETFCNNTQEKRIKNFYENIVQHYNDEDFKNELQMTKSTFQALVTHLREHANPKLSIIPLDKKVLIFLWLLTRNASYTEVATLFGLHKSSVGYIFHEIARMLEEVKYNFITWPSLEEQHMIKLRLNSKFKVPNCVGFIDACRFNMGLKLSKKYIKTNYVLLQAVCDDSLMFIDVFVGGIGHLKKKYVFKNSSLALELENFVDFDNHILGSIDYGLNINLITPYNCDEILTSEEMNFNEAHQRAHSHISCAFQMLKDKFKRLNLIDVETDSVKTVLYAACVLHNFIIFHEGNNLIVKEEAVTCDNEVIVDSEIVKNAKDKRDYLCSYVNIIAEHNTDIN